MHVHYKNMYRNTKVYFTINIININIILILNILVFLKVDTMAKL